MREQCDRECQLGYRVSKIQPDEGIGANPKEQDSIFYRCEHGQRNHSVDRLDGRLKIESVRKLLRLQVSNSK